MLGRAISAKSAKKVLHGLCCFLCVPLCQALQLAPVPPEIASNHFVVTVDGQTTPVMHAAMNLYFLNFDAGKHRTITVTADTDDFWAKGVEVQPWRLNIRPLRNGRTITFRLDGPAKISISRPGDFVSEAEMLYLFANAAEEHPPTAATPGIRYFGPGAHHENIDAAEGDHIYLAPGAVVFGGLNIWQVDHVTVSGRGVIVYDGPQNPDNDDGWMHKRNWHCIVMDHAHDISIEGVTCVVRSRTWQIQMKESRRIVFDNIKVIGANVGNANADGMDWLGGGDTVVRDSFFRAADDIFALQTSWDGYGPVAFAAQGSPVTNITVERNVLSTSISNIVRAGWPEKNFEGGNFSMRDSDVIHMGPGGCGIPFALMELWADPNGRGQSAGFHFENIRMEDWYSLTQVRQPIDGVHDVTFTDVMGLELPSLVPSVLKGSVQGVSLHNTVLAAASIQNDAELPLAALDGAAQPSFSDDGPGARIAITTGLIRPGQRVHLEAVVASGKRSDLRYAWTFGDGTHATGRKVTHKFSDTNGTLLDGSGRFRVLLEMTDDAGRHTWLYQPVIVAETLRPAKPSSDGTLGLSYTYSESIGQADAASPLTGVADTISLAAVPHSASGYSIAFDGDVDFPADGGYSFLMIANENASIELDGIRLATSLKPLPQVCGLAGMAARDIHANVAAAKGKHHIRITESHTAGQDDFRMLWQGPGFSLQPIAPSNVSH